MNFIFSNLEDLFCGFFFIYNSNIFIYLKQKILENIFYFISNNSIIILTHGEKILNLKVQGQIMDKFLVWRTKFLYRMSLMAGRAWMIVAHFVSWKRKWRRCSPFVQRLCGYYIRAEARFVFWRSFTFSFHFASMMRSPISLIIKVISIYPTYGAVVIGLLTACYTLPLLENAT